MTVAASESALAYCRLIDDSCAVSLQATSQPNGTVTITAALKSADL